MKSGFTRKKIQLDKKDADLCREIAEMIAIEDPVLKINTIVGIAMGKDPAHREEILSLVVYSIEAVLNEQPKDAEKTVQRLINGLRLEWLKQQLQEVYWT